MIDDLSKDKFTIEIKNQEKIYKKNFSEIPKTPKIEYNINNSQIISLKSLEQISEISKNFQKEFYTFRKFFPQQQINLNFNPSYLKPITPDNNTFTFQAETQITPDNIAQFAFPIVQFMQQTRPDYVIACDRGARLLGFAVHLLYQELYGELPTRNHSLMFRRISKSVPQDQTAAYLKPDIDAMMAEVPNPRVLVLDDWVSSGRTKDIVNEIFDAQTGGKANVLFGVMRGAGADISGDQNSSAMTQWRDNENLIGVNYEATEGHKVESPEAIAYRKRIVNGIKRFAHDLHKQPVAA